MSKKGVAVGNRKVAIKVALIALCFAAPVIAWAQWTTSGSDIHNSNSGNVGVGTSSPSYTLDINGTLGITGTYPAIAKNSDQRGRSLEELCSRLFATVPGFAVSGRLLTATEEIDISIINDSAEPRLRRAVRRGRAGTAAQAREAESPRPRRPRR